jgi:hypothetical protein
MYVHRIEIVSDGTTEVIHDVVTPGFGAALTRVRKHPLIGRRVVVKLSEAVFIAEYRVRGTPTLIKITREREYPTSQYYREKVARRRR